MIGNYLPLAGHRAEGDGPLFRPVRNNRTRQLDRPLNPSSIYRNAVGKHEQGGRILAGFSMRKQAAGGRAEMFPVKLDTDEVASDAAGGGQGGAGAAERIEHDVAGASKSMDEGL